ncbi:MAG TPA: peptidase M15 [Treponema sp.]|nr:peptidase M15 [Treponema sp.]
MTDRSFFKTAILGTAACALLAFSACAKPKGREPAAAPASQGTGGTADAVQQNPELEKLARVLQSMSPRCKAAIPNGDPEEFLADLHTVLAEQETFRSDDLSLYYLIDKKHHVSDSYVPKDLMPVKNNNLWNVSRNDLSLRPEAYAGLEELSKAALADGIKLMVSSTYRSYAYQERLFNRYVAEDGVELAERYSARPGTSQHQLGVAVDFGSITDDWGDTKMGKWVYSHAADYGWSLSFPKGYEDITGYMWECWHFRYIGVTACRFQKKWFGDIQQFMFEFIDAWEKD